MVQRSTKLPAMPMGPSVPARAMSGEYSSPPCFMHELGPDFDDFDTGSGHFRPRNSEICGSDWPSVRQWRKQTRAVLIDRRVNISAQDRVSWSERISRALQASLSSASDSVIGFYWPFRGEFDPRPLLTELRNGGARLALPVVVAKAHPLQFRAWSPGMRMVRGVWNIPIPADDVAIDPDVLIAPLVGFDPAGYRLGYGGGFYDRTIASKPRKPLIIGVGFALARLATIYPQAHDVPMDVIVTEAGAWPRPA